MVQDILDEFVEINDDSNPKAYDALDFKKEYLLDTAVSENLSGDSLNDDYIVNVGEFLNSLSS